MKKASACLDIPTTPSPDSTLEALAQSRDSMSKTACAQRCRTRDLRQKARRINLQVAWRTNRNLTNCYNLFRCAVRSCRPARPRRPSGEPAVCAGSSEEHTSELQSLLRLSYAVFCL